MILVDSSVWIDFFRDRDTVQTSFLKENLPKARLLTADLVLAEVLQGMRDERSASRAERLLSSLSVLRVSDRQIAVLAARHYRSLRAKGITVRKTIDTLLATRCIVDDHVLLYADRDFEPFVRHLGLRAATTPFAGAN